nr:hypothetical protein BaRGS_034041 [Batillaria attramentaria]
MAIVNRDPGLDMVKFLLTETNEKTLKSLLNARACGKFFSPDGGVYWGEYPLAFAACVGDKECARLLLEKGANPNQQDYYGNTVMHLMVLHKNKDMLDFFFSQKGELQGKLDMKNKEGLTPLTLAAKLGYKDMYDHVLKKEVQVFWIYSNVAATGYPLEHIDTISPTGHTNDKSALNLIVYGEDEGHVTMMDRLIVELLEDKWKHFGKFSGFRPIGPFVVMTYKIITGDLVKFFIIYAIFVIGFSQVFPTVPIVMAVIVFPTVPIVMAVIVFPTVPIVMAVIVFPTVPIVMAVIVFPTVPIVMAVIVFPTVPIVMAVIVFPTVPIVMAVIV